MSTDIQTFTLPLDRFDPDLLSSDARTPGTPAFRQAVNEALLATFQGFKGCASVTVDDRQVAVTWSPDSSAGETLLDIAISHLRRGRTAHGVQLLEFLLTRDPDDVNVLYNLGLALSEARRLAEAEDHLTRAVELTPDFINALVALGVAQLRQQNNETAIETLERAVALDPAHPWANRNLGIGHLKLGKHPDKAVEHLRKAVESQPADQGAWLALGDAQSQGGQRNSATDAYKRAIEINPHNELAEVARKASSQLAAHRPDGVSGVAETGDACSSV